MKNHEYYETLANELSMTSMSSPWYNSSIGKQIQIAVNAIIELSDATRVMTATIVDLKREKEDMDNKKCKCLTELRNGLSEVANRSNSWNDCFKIANVVIEAIDSVESMRKWDEDPKNPYQCCPHGYRQIDRLTGSSVCEACDETDANIHTHSDDCWEPDSGCDMGRNPDYAEAVDKGTPEWERWGKNNAFPFLRRLLLSLEVGNEIGPTLAELYSAAQTIYDMAPSDAFTVREAAKQPDPLNKKDIKDLRELLDRMDKSL